MAITLDGTTGITTPGLTNTGTETVVNLTTTGNTTLGDATSDTLTVGVTGIVKDASGNVGIGTASVLGSTKLEVYGSSAGAHVGIRANNAAADGYGTVWVSNNGSNDGLIRGGATASAFTGQLAVNTSTAIPITFYTNNTERMRIDSSGNLLVGATSAPSISGVPSNSCIVSSSATGNWQLGIQNTSSSGGPRGVAVQYSAQAPNGTASEPFFFTDSAAYRFSVRSNGGIANYSANNVNISDRREKTNFAPAKSYLDVICAIPVQTFNYIDQNLEEDDGLTLGVVAQDVQAVAPELVMESDWSSERDGSKVRLSIYQTDLQYALMKCIQEQQALITSLTARITALEAP